MLICRHCGWENPDEAAFCTNCGRGLIRGRVVESPDAANGGRFRALGSPVVTVQASEPPAAADPPLPRLRAPAQAASTPTLLDFRMPEQMLAELSRMRRKPASQPSAKGDAATPGEESEEAARPTTPIRPLSVGPASQAPPQVDRTTDAADPMATAQRGNLGDIARALRAEDPPKAPTPADTAELVSQPPRAAEDARRAKPAPADPGPAFLLEDDLDVAPTIDRELFDSADDLRLDPPTIDPGEVLPDEPSHAPLPLLPAEDEVHLLTQRRVTTKPPPGLYADPPMEELPFFESSDEFSVPPAAAPISDEDSDLPFVLGPELEIKPSAVDAEPPGASVDLLPPDGSVDFESGEFSAEAVDVPVAEADDALAAPAFEGDHAPSDEAPSDEAPSEEPPSADEPDADEPDEPAPDASAPGPFVSTEEFAAVIARVDAAGAAAPADAEPLDADAEVVIEDVEDVEDEGLLDSGDMEAIILTTQTDQGVVRAAPPPMPAAASARFVLRPLSENLDESFVVGVGDEPIDIGRLAGDICFEGDAYLSPLHARFEIIDDTLMVTDLDSVNGVWLRVRGEAEIEAGDVFLCGQQVIRLDVRRKTPTAGPADGTARIGAASSGTGLALAVLDVDAEVATQYRVPSAGCRLGRQLADVVFTDDAFMSGTHALVQPRGASALLRDLDSRNGVWIRLAASTALSIGDAVMLGRTVLRVGQPSG